MKNLTIIFLKTIRISMKIAINFKWVSFSLLTIPQIRGVIVNLRGNLSLGRESKLIKQTNLNFCIFYMSH